jgi:acetyltransferase-like isoleucine patch superfamily enzyme
VVLCGNVSIREEGVHQSGAVFIPGISAGKGAVVGVVVLKDVGHIPK